MPFGSHVFVYPDSNSYCLPLMTNESVTGTTDVRLYDTWNSARANSNALLRGPHV